MHDGQAVLGEHRGQGRGHMIVILDEQQSHLASFRVHAYRPQGIYGDGRPMRQEVATSAPPSVTQPVRRGHHHGAVSTADAALRARGPVAAGSLCSSSPQM
ncbi:hypothetical protein Sgleb_19950 [Streptomyces glebosus]|uniref:Uncharacterized protein n=1 Tax=Streptomyces glebosus TaxID=249580 RepID=A0A640SSE6_9ACTN|nr:hypothetical protein Sgleb_19950 [Streptomyces glebosus]GHG81314.1 hypothetical protein GCM10010513_59770 [Streptomyces glebosus]